VVVTHVDRLYRRVTDYLELSEALAKANCWVKSINTSDLRPNDAGTKVLNTVMAAIAENESELKTVRLVDRHRTIAEEGGYSGGPRPYGYRPDGNGGLVIVRDEAEVIRDAAERVLGGESVASICSDLNRRGVQTISAKEWRAGDLHQTIKGVANGRITLTRQERAVIRRAERRMEAGDPLSAVCADLTAKEVPVISRSVWRTPTLRAVLTSARVAGKRAYVGKESRDKGKPAAEQFVTDARWPAILPEPTWVALRRVIADPARQGKRSTPHRYMLTGGIARCGLCGQPLHARRKQSGARAMACIASVDKDGCGGLEVVAEPVERFVRKYVTDQFSSGEVERFVDEKPPADAEHILIEMRRIENDVADLEAQVRAGDLGAAQFGRMNGGMQEDLRQLEAEFAMLTKASAGARFVGRGDLLERSWDDLSLSAQRAIIGSVVERVDIRKGNPGPKFDYDRIDIIDRQL